METLKRSEILYRELEALREIRYSKDVDSREVREKMILKRRELAVARREEDAEERTQFFRNLGLQFGLLDHPRFQRLCDMAWEDGHSCGYEEVRIHFERLMELLP